MIGQIKTITGRGENRKMNNYVNLRMYGRSDILDDVDAEMGFDVSDTDYLSRYDRIGLNVVRKCIDTLTAKITKDRVSPRFLTEGGSWKQQKRAGKLEKFVKGVAYYNKWNDMGRQISNDAEIFGDGIVKFVPDLSESGFPLKYERVVAPKLVVDEAEALYAPPKTLYQVEFVNKYDLADQYPNQAELIKKGGSESEISKNFLFGNKELIPVFEGWRLPNVFGQNGRHTICIDGADLLDDDWTMPEFPFEFYKSSILPMGFWGLGTAEKLQSLQVAINKLLIDIQHIIHIGCVPKIFIDMDSRVYSSSFDNSIGGLIKFKGAKPTYEQLMKVPPELWDQLKYLHDKAFEEIGLSQMSANSTKPADLDSGKAIREFANIETDRFATKSLDWQSFNTRVFDKTIMFCEMLGKKKPSMAVKVPTKSGYDKLKWSEVNMARDSIVIRNYPKNYLSDDPSNRLADVQDLTNAGLIDARQSKRLMNFPDLEAFWKFDNVEEDDAYAIIDAMIEEDKYIPPEPHMDLDYYVEVMRKAKIYYARFKDVPDGAKLINTWIEDALDIMKAATPAPPTGPLGPQQPELQNNLNMEALNESAI